MEIDVKTLMPTRFVSLILNVVPKDTGTIELI